MLLTEGKLNLFSFLWDVNNIKQILIRHINILKGEGWFERFEDEHTSVFFPTHDEAEKYRNEEITTEQWALERNRYVSENNTTNSFWCKQGIFMIETASVNCSTTNNFGFKIIVSS